MTISSNDDPKAGPYNGNDSQTVFPFSFRSFLSTDLLVVRTDEDGVEHNLVPGSDYSVSLNADQNANPGGSVTYPLSGTPLPTGETLTIVSDLEYLQPLNLLNGGNFSPSAQNSAFDRVTMLVKQVKEKVSRALQLAVSTPAGVDVTLPVPEASKVIGWSADGTSLANFAADTSVSTDLFADRLADTSSASNGDALIGVKYAASNSVALNLHSYIEDDGAYNVMGFIAAADKAAIRDGSSTTDQSTALSNALAAAYEESPKGLRFAAGKYPVVAGATLTVDGNRTNHGFRISGVGQYGSRIVKLSGANAPITITTTSPTTAPQEIGLSISDLGFVGASKGSHGLNLIGIANFELERLAIRGFDSGLKLDSSLIGLVRSCYISDNNIGVITRQNGSNANCNAIEFQACAIKYNSSWGADIGKANGISFTGWSDIERNGTTLTLTTGGVIIRSTVGDDSGIGIISFDKVWMESNYGRTIDVESSTDLFLTVRQANILSPEGGYAMRVQGGRSVSFENSVAAGNTATLDITCEKFSMYNARADVVTDNSTYGIYDNSGTSAADYVSGRTGSYTASLTGCTTVPTGSVAWTKQGKTVTLNVPVITGTSNTTAATLTGMPASLYPSVARQTFAATVDNGTEKFSPITIGTDGVITLNNAFSGTFTNSGTKGTSSGWTITYEI